MNASILISAIAIGAGLVLIADILRIRHVASSARQASLDQLASLPRGRERVTAILDTFTDKPGGVR